MANKVKYKKLFLEYVGYIILAEQLQLSVLSMMFHT